MTVLLRDREIMYRLGVKSKTSLWRYRKTGILPTPKKINGVNVTPEGDVEKAIQRVIEGEAA